ncbi:MAG TPA: glycosyltransferase [Candidatus Babeliales bacterium]|nr:glycosyltransferase [Candidatus Babeliales bacterium]
MLSFFVLVFVGWANLSFSIPQLADFDIACGKGDSYYQRPYERCTKRFDAPGSFSFKWLGGQTHAQAFIKLREIFNEKFLNRALIETNTYRIPPIIHIIWLGSNLPEKYSKWVNSWKAHHPDWQIILWNDELVKNINLFNQDLYDRATNFGEKSDILRCELLFQFGGLYVDTDFECLKPFDELHKYCDFFAGMIPVDAFSVNDDGSGVLLGSALMGSIPGHPFMETMLHNMQRFKNEPGIVTRTGPWLLTRSFFEYAPEDQLISVIFPPTYFYPINSPYIQQAGKGYSHNYIKNETYAIHWWEASWAKE